MNELEAKFRCLELAAGICRQQGITAVNSIVEISTNFYNHINPSSEPVSKPVQKTSKKDNRPEFLG